MRRETPPRASNDNQPGKHKARWTWDVHREAARARYFGRVVASTAVEFRTDIKKLIAVRRWEVA
jgi:hypothetical protein